MRKHVSFFFKTFFGGEVGVTAPPPHVRNDILGKWSLARASSYEGEFFLESREVNKNKCDAGKQVFFFSRAFG